MNTGAIKTRISIRVFTITHLHMHDGAANSYQYKEITSAGFTFDIRRSSAGI